MAKQKLTNGTFPQRYSGWESTVRGWEEAGRITAPGEYKNLTVTLGQVANSGKLNATNKEMAAGLLERMLTVANTSSVGSSDSSSGSSTKNDPTKNDPNRIRRQPVYDSISVGEEVEIYRADQSRNGNDLTKRIAGTRVFISNPLGYESGWTGTIRITERNSYNGMYSAEIVSTQDGNKGRERNPIRRGSSNRDGQPPRDSKPAPTPTPTFSQPQLPTERQYITIGGIGGGDEIDVWIPETAYSMKGTEWFNEILSNGEPVHSQDAPTLKARADLTRRTYQIGGKALNPNKTLLNYITDGTITVNNESGTVVAVGTEEVKAPSATEVIPAEKKPTKKKSSKRGSSSSSSSKRKKSSSGGAVSVGSRSGGGSSLEHILFE